MESGICLAPCAIVMTSLVSSLHAFVPAPSYSLAKLHNRPRLVRAQPAPKFARLHQPRLLKNDSHLSREKVWPSQIRFVCSRRQTDDCEPSQTHKPLPTQGWLANRTRIGYRDAKAP